MFFVSRRVMLFTGQGTRDRKDGTRDRGSGCVAGYSFESKSVRSSICMSFSVYS